LDPRKWGGKHKRFRTTRSSGDGRTNSLKGVWGNSESLTKLMKSKLQRPLGREIKVLLRLGGLKGEPGPGTPVQKKGFCRENRVDQGDVPRR